MIDAICKLCHGFGKTMARLTFVSSNPLQKQHGINFPRGVDASIFTQQFRFRKQNLVIWWLVWGVGGVFLLNKHGKWWFNIQDVGTVDDCFSHISSWDFSAPKNSPSQAGHELESMIFYLSQKLVEGTRWKTNMEHNLGGWKIIFLLNGWFAGSMLILQGVNVVVESNVPFSVGMGFFQGSPTILGVFRVFVVSFNTLW